MEQEKIEILIKKFVEDLDKWMNEKHHSDNCVAHNEGQYCCLDEIIHEPFINDTYVVQGRKFIIEWLRENLK